MYFLLAVRKHPLQAFITYGGRLSVLWLLGVPTDAITLYLALAAANAHVQHANIRMRTGPLGFVFATPGAAPAAPLEAERASSTRTSATC